MASLRGLTGLAFGIFDTSTGIKPSSVAGSISSGSGLALICGKVANALNALM